MSRAEELHRERCPGPTGLLKPEDPTKILTRTTKRVVNFLLRGGRLRKVQRRRKDMGHLPDPDPQAYNFILEPPPGITLRWQNYRVPDKRFVRKTTILYMIEIGLLKRQWLDPDEAGAVDVTDLAKDADERTDWNGNWIKGERQ